MRYTLYTVYRCSPNESWTFGRTKCAGLHRCDLDNADTEITDCTAKVVFSDTSALSATLARIPPSSRSRVLPQRRMPSSTLERCVDCLRNQGRKLMQRTVACGLCLQSKEGDCWHQSEGYLGVRALDLCEDDSMLIFGVKTSDPATRWIWCCQVKIPYQPPSPGIRRHCPHRTSRNYTFPHPH